MTGSAVVRLLAWFAVWVFAAGIPADGLGGQIKRQQAAQQPGLQQQINCPAAQVRTEITTKLPTPWWNTPQIGKLESVLVQNIGGKQTLVCRYEAYGTKVSVMRLFPEGARGCSAAGNHFMCR